MTASYLDFPDDARKAVLEGMYQRASTRGFWTPKLRSAHSKALQLCYPQRVAVLPLHRLLSLKLHSEADLDALAELLGWRFLIFETSSTSDPIAAAFAVLTESGEYRLAELNEGQYVSNTMKGIETASSLLQGPLKPDGDLVPDMLLLIVPGVYFVGLWARYDGRGQDWVLPIDPTIHGLDREKPLKPAELLANLRKAARRAAGH
ncbi:MAG: hypothetical protein K2X57_15045 [Xanthobacteraceae bacterium]|nr:hypothetical protein [Xanthobacteraceae bacterium]